MRFARIMTATIIVLLAALAGLTQYLAHNVNQRFPAQGNFADIDGVRLHFLDLAADAGKQDLLPMIFLHGASGNARDLHGALGGKMRGRARMIFIDRPGSGHSQRGGDGMDAPDAQARLVAGLMHSLGIERAVIVGHSLGAAVAVAFAVDHKDRTAGLVLISPATHPWPGGGVSWYYDVANFPVLGRLFCETLAIPAGNLMFEKALKGVFAPDEVASGYEAVSGAELILRPANFAHNARDVGGLFAHVTRLSPRYGEITAPTVIISGDADDVVRADIHSIGLERDISGAKLVWLENTGHTPAWSAPDKVIAEIVELNARTAALDGQ